MKLEKVERLIAFLRQSGVSYFKDADLEIRFQEGVAKVEPASPSSVSSPEESLGSKPASSVPPVEMSIPHHVNEVANLLKLSDEDLVDKLFPDFTAEPKE